MEVGKKTKKEKKQSEKKPISYFLTYIVYKYGLSVVML